MIFLISTRGCWHSLLDRRIWCSNREPLRVLLPLLFIWCPLNNGNCRLTMPIAEGRCAREALPISLISACLNPVKRILQHILSLYANLIDSCDFAFDANDWWNSHKRCQWLALKLAAMKILMPFPAKIHSHVMIYYNSPLLIMSSIH